MNYPVDAISVGERRREDYGDLASLSNSIERYGLLHPIVIDDEGNLVAGGRRLEAVKLLGWSSVAVTRLGELSENERRAIELEENLRRKDLTTYEQNRTLGQLVATVREIEVEESSDAIDSGCAESAQPELRPQNRPQPGSLRRVSQRIGIPVKTINDAQHHVETADAFPVMQSWPQYRVLEARQHLNALPKDERGQAVALISEPGTPPDTAVGMLANLAKMPRPERAEIYTLYASTDDHERGRAKAAAARLPPKPSPALIAWELAETEIKRAIKATADESIRARGAEARGIVRAIISQLEESYAHERSQFVA